MYVYHRYSLGVCVRVGEVIMFSDIIIMFSVRYNYYYGVVIFIENPVYVFERCVRMWRIGGVIW